MAIVCTSDVQFQTFCRWQGVEPYDTNHPPPEDETVRGFRILSDQSAKEYVRLFGKPPRTRVVILPMNHMPVGILPTLGYKRRPDKPREAQPSAPATT
jgi:hypothetical protein